MTNALEKARLKKVFLRSAIYFALSGAALALVIWSFLATRIIEQGRCGETVGPMFPWGVAKPWRFEAYARCS